MMTLLQLWSILAGLLIGSFLNVCIYRLPRGQSIVIPARSFCPNCGRFIVWYDNIPVLSYLFLGGRCRHCHKQISVRYPAVELITAILAFLTVRQWGFTLAPLYLFLFLMAPLVAITFIDLEHKIIPDIFSISGMLAGIIFNLIFPLLHEDAYQRSFPIIGSLLFSLKGILIGGGALFAISWLYEKIRHEEGIGGGDIKLTAMLGAYFGWKGIFVILLLSSLSGSIIGIILLVFQRKGLKAAVPFGPFLSLGALIYLFLGDKIIFRYLELTHRLY